MKNTNGFTLIELIAVIIITGILAAVALPRFLGVQHEARLAMMKNLEANIKTVNEIAYGKLVIKSLENSYCQGNTGANISLALCAIANGSIHGYGGGILASDLIKALDLKDQDFYFYDAANKQSAARYQAVVTGSTMLVITPKSLPDPGQYSTYVTGIYQDKPGCYLIFGVTETHSKSKSALYQKDYTQC